MQKGGKKMEVRHVKKEEVKDLYQLIKELADYLGDEIFMTEEELEKALFEEKSCYALLAFKDNKPQGYALYYYTFSTVTGKKGIYLLDLYVRKEARRFGLGKALFKGLAKVAKEKDCCRIDWDCLKWNTSSIDFYHSLGASVRDDHDFFRLEDQQIDHLVSESK